MTATQLTLKDAVGPNGLVIDGDWIESKDQDPNGDVRLVQLADIGDGDYLNKSARYLTSSKARELRCTMLQPGDVLVSRMADPIGRACIFPGDLKPCVTVVDICVVRPDQTRVLPEWLKYAINEPRFRVGVQSRAVGATRPRISGKNLQAMTIGVPSIDEQRRVVDLLSRAENIVRMRREAEQKAKEIIPALFLDMFGDPATNPMHWPVEKFRELGTLDRGRSRHRPRDASHLYGGPHPFVQTGDVTRSGGAITTYTQTYSDAGLAQSRLWPVGTLCITIAANIAETGVLDFEACFPDSVVGFLPGAGVRTAYIQQWLGFLQPTLAAQAPQAAQKNINLEILRNLNVPVPPIGLQDTFKAHATQLRLMEESQKAASALGDEAFQSVLTGVFGEEQT
jgi:type I restriction enzyme S subunit